MADTKIFSTVLSASVLESALLHRDWRGMKAEIGDIKKAGATLNVSKGAEWVRIEVVFCNACCAKVINDLDPRDCDQIAKSLKQAGVNATEMLINT